MLDFNLILPPKSQRFSPLVGYSIQSSSSSANQNAALLIDHWLDFTKYKIYGPFGNPVHQIDQHFWILCKKIKVMLRCISFFYVFAHGAKYCVLRDGVKIPDNYQIRKHHLHKK